MDEAMTPEREEEIREYLCVEHQNPFVALDYLYEIIELLDEERKNAAALACSFILSCDDHDETKENLDTETLKLWTAQRENEKLRLQNAKLLDALIWCSGSDDFGPGGIAEEGFQKLVRPLLTLAAPDETNG